MAAKDGEKLSLVPNKQKQQKKKREKAKDNGEYLKNLGQQLLTSRAHINNLPILLTYITPNSPPQHALESLLSLQSFFTPLLPQLSSSSANSANQEPDPEIVYLTWLRSKFDDFVRCLVDILVSPQSEDALREIVLDAVMEFVKVGNAGKFHSAIYHKLLRAIIHSELGAEDIVLVLLASKYFTYIDVCYFTYISLEKLVRTLEAKEDGNASLDAEKKIQSKTSMELSIQKMKFLLSRIPQLEALEENLQMWNGLGLFVEKDNKQETIAVKDKNTKKSQKSGDKVLSSRSIAKKLKLKLTKAWLSFLRLPLPLSVYKEVLVALHQSVIPYISNPIMLCDFLTQSYDIGGVVSVMALSSLYVLMTQHGLEYPNFYDKLYALLEPAIFIAKHRAKFFQLLDASLKSSLLPAYLAAAFCKKLSRLALFVPPSGAIVIVALVNNLLQKHPSISCLVHQERDTGETLIGEKRKQGIDHFKNEEMDPKKTNAIRSSLWEMDTLRHHYCAPVSRFAVSLANDLAVSARVPEISVIDLSSGSYGTIFNDEMKRRVKQVSVAFYNATPTSLFSESDFPGWEFKFTANGSEPHEESAKRQRTVGVEA
ncbi:hypothetical protein ACP275_02G136400 [Erythranthe tilingii]